MQTIISLISNFTYPVNTLRTLSMANKTQKATGNPLDRFKIFCCIFGIWWELGLLFMLPIVYNRK